MRLTTEEFIARSRKTHGDKYDYSKVDYVNNHTKVCIVCPEHGEFWMEPNNHMNGQKCPTCSGKFKRDTDWFVSEARKVHGDKYDYSQVEYTGSQVKVPIICKDCGNTFWQTPNKHLQKRGCPICHSKPGKSANQDVLNEAFIQRVKTIHGDRYDYSQVEYVNNDTKVRIGCPVHGFFLQRPRLHLGGFGCSKCGCGTMTKDQFVERARAVHGDTYDYSKVEYVSSDAKVCIVCPKHGPFWQTPGNHLQGETCPKCGKERTAEKLSLTTEAFIEKAKAVHGDKYDYSEVDYKNTHTKVCIICPKHGPFWQTPLNHLLGKGCKRCAGFTVLDSESFIDAAEGVFGRGTYDFSRAVFVNHKTKLEVICPKHGSFWKTPNELLSKHAGCPHCRMSHMEVDVRAFLVENGIRFETQKKFETCRNVKPLPFDFYLPDYNLCIECQGIQHFEPSNSYNRKRGFEYRQKIDGIKRSWCEDINNPNLLEVRYDDDLKKTLSEALGVEVNDKEAQ